MPTYNKKIVYLSDAQRQELFANGSIVVGGETFTYDPTDIYVTPQGVNMSIGTVSTLPAGSSATAAIRGTVDNPILDLGIPGTVTEQAVETMVDNWLDDHPEATTTVQDGSVTKAKLDSNLQGTVDDVDGLKSAISNLDAEVYDYKPITAVGFIATGKKIDANGEVSNDSAYNINRYNVVEGDTIQVKAEGRWQFQKTYETGVSYRIGSTREAGTFEVTVPEGAVFVCVTVLAASSDGYVKKRTNKGVLEVEVPRKNLIGEAVGHASTILAINGTISAGTLSNQHVFEIAIPAGYTRIRIEAQGRTGAESVFALYNAESFADCNSDTLVKSGYYVGSATYGDTTAFAIDSNCKMLCVMSRAELYEADAYALTEVGTDAALFAKPYDPLQKYLKGEMCLNDGCLYKRKEDAVSAEVWYDANWQKICYADEVNPVATFAVFSDFLRGNVNGNGNINTQTKYSIVMKDIGHTDRDIRFTVLDGYGVNVAYYNSDGTYNTSLDSGFGSNFYNIVAGSYFRISIRITGSTAYIPSSEFANLISKVTFRSEYGDMEEDISNGVEGYYRSYEAQMYHKGAAPKTFGHAPCILVAGQSNIDGRVPKANLPSTITPPFANIKNNIDSSNGVFATSMPLPSNFGIDFSMYAALNDLGSDVYIIKKALGATSISEFGSSYCWTPFYERLANQNNSLLLTFDKQIKKCVEVNPNIFDIRAFVWQQGEGDFSTLRGGNRDCALDYYKNFKLLVAYVRGVAGNEKLPVICGTVSHNSGQYDPIVEEATLKVASEDPYMTCIDMSEATLLDTYHFDAASAVYFGYKAFDALIDFGVVSGTKINPTPPWDS